MTLLPNRTKKMAISISDDGYRQIFECNPLPSWVYDAETLQILLVNPAASHALGFSQTELLEMQISALCQKSEPSDSSTPVALDKPRSICRLRRKDGTTISAELEQYEVTLENRNAIAVVCKVCSPLSLAEQTNRPNQDLERRVRDRTVQLESTNRELEAFCYSVSHDLRAPLRSIRGFSEVLLERYGPQVDARGQELLRRVCESSQIMDRLIEDLLKLSRVTRVELQRRPVNLSTVAQAIIQELRETEPSRAVECIIAPDLKAEGDERLLHLVLDNLLRNAWKFTSKKEKARIEVGVTDEPERAFFVRDNGAGFDMMYADKLFGVFQRLHSHEFPGTGVGLAIVQRIITRHGGRVWASAEVDKGATFFFTLRTE